MPLTTQSGQYDEPSVSPDGKAVAFLGIDDPLTDPQNRRVGLFDLATGERRWIATGDSTARWAPFPGAQPPIWDGDDLVVAVRGPWQRARLPGAGDGAATRQPLVGGERVVTGYDRAGGTLAFTATHGRPAGGAARHRRRRTGAPAHDGHRALRRPGPPAAGRALRRPVDRRRRGRRLGDHAARLRSRPSATPSCSTSTAARSPSTATGSSTRRRSRPARATSS